MALLRIGALPAEPLAASAAFYADALGRIVSEIEAAPEHLTLVFEPAGHEHRGWRLAAVQELARQYAPLRINALESDDDAAIRSAEIYCGTALGLTGQLLRLDGNGAGAVLYNTA